jgi:hypothetical protein
LQRIVILLRVRLVFLPPLPSFLPLLLTLGPRLRLLHPGHYLGLGPRLRPGLDLWHHSGLRSRLRLRLDSGHHLGLWSRLRLWTELRLRPRLLLDLLLAQMLLLQLLWSWLRLTRQSASLHSLLFQFLQPSLFRRRGPGSLRRGYSARL